MNQSIMLLIPIFLPILAGIGLLLIPEIKKREKLLAIVAFFLFATGSFVVNAVLNCNSEVTLFHLTKTMPIYFKIDAIGKLFVSIVSIIWILVGIYSFVYMKHEKEEKRYFGFYLITFGILVGLDFSGNLVTMYFFYECMTILSVPLVIHNKSREAVMAGLKYLFYSFCGAYMALFGLFFLSKYTTTWSFVPGGVLDMAAVQGHENLILVVAFFMIMGFGVKAGMFPLHAWLPAAHPVAPAPASAALSSIIVKSGVLAIIRVVYFMIGADFLKGSWVQYVWMSLALLTVFIGSMLAYKESVLKKRLAYSTVSQVSYILFGLALMNPIAMTGALLHVVFHAFIKSTLFLVAGAIIYQTGRTKVEQLSGIGKEMPVTIWCFTIVSLGLIGIPPLSGFISKWYLAIGSLQSEIMVYAWLGPVILLVSALLTAGYLLPITIKGFLPGNEFDYTQVKKLEPSKLMVIPIMILTILTALLGIMPNGLIQYITQTIAPLL